MKILVYSFYFAPHGGPGALRPLKMLKYAARNGAKGVVISCAEGDYSVFDQSLLDEVPDEFIVMRTPEGKDPLRFLRKRMTGVIHAPKSDLLFLPDNKTWWINSAARLGVKALPNADLVWATCPPFSAALAARRAAKELGVPLALDFRDSWTKNPNRPALPFPQRAINKMLATKAALAASLITCVYDSIADEFTKLAPNKKIVVIPNGYDPDDLPTELFQPIPSEALNICYLGTVYPNLNYFLPFLHAMKEQSDVLLTVVGRYPHMLQEDIARLGLSPRVKLLPYTEHRRALEIAERSDVMLLYIDNRPLNLGQITSKTYEYMGLGKPILACIPRGGEADSLLKNYQPAFRVTTESVGAISQALRELSELKLNGELPKSQPPAEFDRMTLTARWFEQIKKISCIANTKG